MNVWVIPCNEKHYNHREAFANLDHIDWRQSTNVEVGDEVYIYVGRPVGAVLYKCEAIKVNIANPDNNDVDYSYGELDPVGRYMRLKLLEKYPDDRFPREALLENGLKTVQGPTKATGELISFLERKEIKKYNHFGHSREKKKTDMKERLMEAKTLEERLLCSQKHFFHELKPSDLPKEAGVYAIFDKDSGETLYVGRTKNVQQRLYTNHLMGTETNARLKKYLIEDTEMPDIKTTDDAKEYIKEHCYFQYILVEEMRQRGQIEGLLSFLLNVRYIHEEH